MKTRFRIVLFLLLTPVSDAMPGLQEPGKENIWFDQMIAWTRHTPENVRMDWKLRTEDRRPPANIADIARRAVAEDGLPPITVDRVLQEYPREWYDDKDVVTRTRAGYCHFGEGNVRIVREFGRGTISDPGPDLVGCEFHTDRLVARTSGEYIGVARGEYVYPDGRRQAHRVTASRRLIGDVTEAAEFDVFPLLRQKAQLEVILFEMSPIDIETFAKTGSYTWDVDHTGHLPHDVWIPSRTLIRHGSISSIDSGDELEILISLSRNDGTVLSSVQWTFAKSGSTIVLSHYIASVFLPNGDLREKRDLTILRRKSEPLTKAALSFDRVVPNGAKVEDHRYEPPIVYTKFSGMTDDDVVNAALMADATPRRGGVENGIAGVEGDNDGRRGSSLVRGPRRGVFETLFWVLGLGAVAFFGFRAFRRRASRGSAACILAFLLLVGCDRHAAGNASHFAARVSLSQPNQSIQLGDFLWGGPGDVHIELINDTASPEVISSVYSDCSCLLAFLKPVIVPPDGTVDIPLRVDTGLPGQRSVSLSLKRDGEPEIPLGTASFVVRWGLRPTSGPILDWSFAHGSPAEAGGAPMPFVFFLEEDGLQVERVNHVSLTTPSLLGSVDQVSRGRWHVEFRGGESLPVGRFSSTIQVDFVADGNPCSLQLPIRITSSYPDAPFQSGLDNILMGLVETGKTKEVEAKLVSVDSGWTITEVYPFNADTIDGPVCDIVEDGTAIRVRLTGRHQKKKMMRWTFVATLSPGTSRRPIGKIFEVLAAY